MKVALDAAKGLAFLHSAETKVIYRDFKTSNVLLDSVCGILIFFFQCIITEIGLNNIERDYERSYLHSISETYFLI